MSAYPVMVLTAATRGLMWRRSVERTVTLDQRLANVRKGILTLLPAARISIHARQSTFVACLRQRFLDASTGLALPAFEDTAADVADPTGLLDLTGPAPEHLQQSCAVCVPKAPDTLAPAQMCFLFYAGRRLSGGWLRALSAYDLLGEFRAAENGVSSVMTCALICRARVSRACFEPGGSESGSRRKAAQHQYAVIDLSRL